ncbi:MAG TPA: gamma-glutamylcyclotransferase [Polyangiaceae bacterium]
MSERAGSGGSQALPAVAAGDEAQVAIFAYGSLLYRPGFEFAQRRPALLPGYARSFSQASPDHRGTHERPGRVVTLVARDGASCAGAVYVVRGAGVEQLLRELDHRERAGYERVQLTAICDGQALDAVSWIAPPGNPYDVGQLELAALARHITVASGPSGRNDDYIFLLERALVELGALDPLVSELSELLRSLAVRGERD